MSVGVVAKYLNHIERSIVKNVAGSSARLAVNVVVVKSVLLQTRKEDLDGRMMIGNNECREIHSRSIVGFMGKVNCFLLRIGSSKFCQVGSSSGFQFSS